MLRLLSLNLSWFSSCVVEVLVISSLLLFPVFGVVYDSLSVGFTGSRVNFIDSNGAFLRSANNSFQLGFRSSTDGFYLCVWHPATDFVVWTANRNSRVSISDTLVFQLDGDVVLSNSSAVVWSTGTGNSTATKVQLQETGNLVVLSNDSRVLWQSFDHPTDTLLVEQKFNSVSKLVASVSDGDLSEGSYSLAMFQGDLMLIASVADEEQVYWSMRRDARSTTQANVTGSPAFAMLLGHALGLFTGEGLLVSQFSVGNAGTRPRGLTLKEGGMLEAFYIDNTGATWADSQFFAPGDDASCKLPGTCGPYGICTQGQCRCTDPFVPVNGTNQFLGCQLPENVGRVVAGCSSETIGIVADVRWLQITSPAGGVNYFSNQYVSPVKMGSLSACKELCAQNCSCTALFYWDTTGDCYMVDQVATLQSDDDPKHVAFVKVALPSAKGGTSIATISTICIALLILLASILLGMRICRGRKTGELEDTENMEEEMFLEAIPGLPMRFSYKELERATLSFSTKLGSGGFGSVYEGTLADGSKVAVKKLESLGQGFKEFRAEVATIGSIHHLHLVQLRGFCAEGVHRLLVYEYLANGSLDKSLFSAKKNLQWHQRFNIALGTARGLAYLHEECRERIIHCDIKPENILLDDHFVAKVSDFGLAKLMNRELSQVFTTMRGTRGYLAPEWVTNYAITEKSDVFSYGMVLLEIVSGRKNFDSSETSEKWYFPAYAFRQVEIGNISELLDPKLQGRADGNMVALVLRVALWCIQEDVTLRPSMGKVVHMLEGNIHVPQPPLCSQFFGGLCPKVDAASGSSSHSLHGFDGFGEYEGVKLSQLSAERLSGPR